MTAKALSCLDLSSVWGEGLVGCSNSVWIPPLLVFQSNNFCKLTVQIPRSLQVVICQGCGGGKEGNYFSQFLMHKQVQRCECFPWETVWKCVSLCLYLKDYHISLLTMIVDYLVFLGCFAAMRFAREVLQQHNQKVMKAWMTILVSWGEIMDLILAIFLSWRKHDWTTCVMWLWKQTWVKIILQILPNWHYMAR